MRYEVRIAEEAAAAITAQARYIAEASGYPERAAEWLLECYAKLDTLEHFPRRCGLTPEIDRRDYEVRKLNFGKYLILFRVDEAAKVVYVTGFRHGMRDTSPDVDREAT